MIQSKIQLPVDLYSPDQLSGVIFELRSHISSLRNAHVRAQAENATVGEPIHLSALLLATLHASDVSATDQSSAQQLLQVLEEIRDKAPAVHLMMAALPNRELKRSLTNWFREQIHPTALLTFATRADIGGGVVIQAGSHIYDYSFRRQILMHKQRIGEIFHHVS